MEILDILNQSGLNQKEASVYLALLELGTASVQAIAKKAGLKRPTTYLILDNLQSQSLVSLIPRAKKILYSAQSPEKLILDLQKKQELLKRFMPNLLALFNVKAQKPQVLLFEGKEAVREIYENILNSKNVAWFSTIRDVLQTYPDFPKKLNIHAMQGKTKVRELLTKSETDIEYAKTMSHGPNFIQKFSSQKGQFFTDNCLFDGSVAFFYFEPIVSVVQIKSQGIYESLKTLYEFAWEAAESYEKVIENKTL